MAIAELDTPNAVDLVFSNWLTELAGAFESRDPGAFAGLFSNEGHWRDILSFTWEHRTFSGKEQIAHAFQASTGKVEAKNFRPAAGRSPPIRVRRMRREAIEGYFNFDTVHGLGTGFVRLLVDGAGPGKPSVWLLLTTLHQIRGHEEQVGERRQTGDAYSQIVSPINWKQERERERRFEDCDPPVVIVGAGQAGLMLAARLRLMGVNSLVIDRSARVGDVWRHRYNNLTLHNEIYANHFPYLEFPQNWPLWLPKDMMAGWLEAYAQFLELNVWTSSEVASSRFDATSRQWHLGIRQADNAVRVVRCKHVVMATGVSGDTPRKPALPGQERFRGAIVHSGEFRSGLDWKGKRALVIGTGNSGHDVAQDLFVSGAETVTIMQRGATCVTSLSPSARIVYAAYAEGRPVEDVDLMASALPFPMVKETYKWVTNKTRELDKELLAGLHAVGFKTHDGEDGTGFQFMYWRGAGGYYIDVGCCELIANRSIGLIHASDMLSLEDDGVRMKDGNLIPIDLIVLATGFETMEAGVRRVLGDAVAQKIGPVWGFDQDHVMRNMWRRTAVEGVWLTGGALTEARTYSRYLALEIIAALEGRLPAREQMPLVPRLAP